jgi:hypothetical protein
MDLPPLTQARPRLSHSFGTWYEVSRTAGEQVTFAGGSFRRGGEVIEAPEPPPVAINEVGSVEWSLDLQDFVVARFGRDRDRRENGQPGLGSMLRVSGRGEGRRAGCWCDLEKLSRLLRQDRVHVGGHEAGQIIDRSVQGEYLAKSRTGDGEIPPLTGLRSEKRKAPALE